MTGHPKTSQTFFGQWKECWCAKHLRLLLSLQSPPRWIARGSSRVYITERRLGGWSFVLAL
jgi:hypothetical protein